VESSGHGQRHRQSRLREAKIHGFKGRSTVKTCSNHAQKPPALGISGNNFTYNFTHLCFRLDTPLAIGFFGQKSGSDSPKNGSSPVESNHPLFFFGSFPHSYMPIIDNLIIDISLIHGYSPHHLFSNMVKYQKS
jgi:hypothetical protein